MWFVQLFDMIFSILNMPRGLAVFEDRWLSLVAPGFSSMIEARQREDETECDMEVNGAFLCHFDDLMYYSVTLNAEACRHTYAQVVHACVCTDCFWVWACWMKGQIWRKQLGRCEKKFKTHENVIAITQKISNNLLISCTNIFKSEKHLHNMMTLLLFYCLILPQCLIWVPLGFMGVWRCLDQLSRDLKTNLWPLRIC